MDFIYGYPRDKHGHTGVLVFVDRFSKMIHLAAVRDTIKSREAARIFLDTVFRLHGMPLEIVSDRDPKFTAKFWRELFQMLGTRLAMSTADHPEFTAKFWRELFQLLGTRLAIPRQMVKPNA